MYNIITLSSIILFFKYALFPLASIALFGFIRFSMLKKRKKQIDSAMIFDKNVVIGALDFLNIPNRETKQAANVESFGLEIVDEAINAMLNGSFEKSQAKFYQLEDYIRGLTDTNSSYFLDGKFHQIASLLKELEQEFFLQGCSAISFHIGDITVDQIRCDLIVLKKTLSRFVKNFSEKIHSYNPGADLHISLTFSPTTINYVRGFDSFVGMKDLLRREPAICITLSEWSLSIKIDKFVNSIYTKSLAILENTIDCDAEFKDIINGIDAHYGLIEIFDADLIWNLILPIDVYAVRPVVLDLSDPVDNFYNYPQAKELEEKFLKELQTDFPTLPIDKFVKALNVIKIYHSHQIRKSGEPFFMHPLSVGINLLQLIKVEQSEIISSLKENIEVLLLGALLHDVLEDTVYTNRAILANFGHYVGSVVLEVTKINVDSRAIMLKNTEAFSVLISKEALPLTIKLLDRYHNLLTIAGHKSIDKRRLVAQETLDFFIEPAERYGFNNLTNLLKTMCKTILNTGSLDAEKFIY